MNEGDVNYMITRIAFFLTVNARKIFLGFLATGVILVIVFQLFMMSYVADSGMQFMDNVGGMTGNITRDIMKYQNFGSGEFGGVGLNNSTEFGGIVDFNYKKGYDMFNNTVNNTMKIFRIEM